MLVAFGDENINSIFLTCVDTNGVSAGNEITGFEAHEYGRQIKINAISVALFESFIIFSKFPRARARGFTLTPVSRVKINCQTENCCLQLHTAN